MNFKLLVICFSIPKNIPEFSIKNSYLLANSLIFSGFGFKIVKLDLPSIWSLVLHFPILRKETSQYSLPYESYFPDRQVGACYILRTMWFPSSVLVLSLCFWQLWVIFSHVCVDRYSVQYLWVTSADLPVFLSLSLSSVIFCSTNSRCFCLPGSLFLSAQLKKSTRFLWLFLHKPQLIK